MDALSLFGFGGSGEESRAGLVPNPFENPAVPLSSVGLDNVFGLLRGQDGQESVTIDTSLAIPTMWRCVGLMSTIIAGCPLRAYKTDGRKEIFPEILSPGNGSMTYTQFELWELVVTHLMTWGNAFVLKYRDPTDYRNIRVPPDHRIITDLRPVNPDRVAVRMDGGNKIFEITRVNEQGQPDINKPKLILTTFEIMHIPGLGYDGAQGLSPIQLASRTIGTAIAADKLAQRFYSKGTMLSGIINVKAPLANQKQADQIRNRWIQKSGGVAHGADVAVLDAETDFQPLTIPPDSLQFLESRRWQTTEIARMFGIPPHLVGDVEKTTSWGTGIEQQNIAFASYTVSGYTNRIQQRVSREVIPLSTQFCEFDLNRIMRGDMNERFTAYMTGIMAGWLTRNEAREMENREPIDGLDEPWTPTNVAPQGGEADLGTGNPDAGANASPTSGASPGSAGKSSTKRGSLNGHSEYSPDYLEVPQ